jgi:uncharacterized protein
MSLPSHSISSAAFDALAAGTDASDAVRELINSQLSKHRILLRSVLTEGIRAVPEDGDSFSRAWKLLAAAHRHDRAATEEVIRYPAVGAWALETVMALRGASDDPKASPAQLSSVAAVAAIRARLPAKIKVPVDGQSVVLPSLGTAVANGRSATVRWHEGQAFVDSAGAQVRVPAQPQLDAPGWRGVRAIGSGSLRLLLDDLDPFRMPASHDLRGHSGLDEVNAWTVSLDQAWRLLSSRQPAAASEIAQIVKVIVPLATPTDGHISCSSPRAFGATALSLTSDHYACALALLHEVQHLKLSALTDVVDLVRPDDGHRYYAPWRDDPRPIDGLLQGAYAHLGVSAFWRAQRGATDADVRARADAEFARWRSAAAKAVEILRASNRLTLDGSRFAQGMADTLTNWAGEPVPVWARESAAKEEQQHLARWVARNGPMAGRARP